MSKLSKSRRGLSLLGPASAAALSGAAFAPAFADTTHPHDIALSTIPAGNFAMLDNGIALVLLDNGLAIALTAEQVSIDQHGNLLVLDPIALARIASVSSQADIVGPHPYHVAYNVVDNDYPAYQLDAQYSTQLDSASLRMQASAPKVPFEATVGAVAGVAAFPIVSAAVLAGAGAFSGGSETAGRTSLSGFAIDGVLGDGSGRSVSDAGDINGDGYADIIIGAPGAGQSYVIFGREGGYDQDLDLGNLNQDQGFKLTGIPSSVEGSGWSVASAGDVNGDSIDDIIIGTRFGMRVDNPNVFAGRSYVVFGKNSDAQGSFPQSFDLTGLATGGGSDGFVIVGENQFELAGTSVSSAGDFNNDGIDDIVIGSNFGRSYVVFGKDTVNGAAQPFDQVLTPFVFLDGNQGFVINGQSDGSDGNSVVSSAGDVNGDNYDDLIIGLGNGKSYVVFGQSDTDRLNDSDYNVDGGADAGDSLDLSSLSNSGASDGFEISGISLNGYLDENSDVVAGSRGMVVSSAGRFNNDNYDDLIISAWEKSSADAWSGQSYVVFGQQTFGGDLDIGALDGSNGFKIEGVSSSDVDSFNVATAGDINNDGRDDIIVSVVSDSVIGYVLFGSNSAFGASFDVSNLDGENGFAITGSGSGSTIDVDIEGYAVSSAGDIDGDGFDDILVGDQTANPGDSAAAGASYVIYGMENFDSAVNLGDLFGLT